MTIRGYVDDFYQAIPIATQLGLELITTQNYELADGTVEEELVFLGHVIFGDEKPVTVVLTDSEDAF
ncbi:TPA: hypothetical protein EYP66_09125 [Candidatus Poribacteria bacterium]|nr:hypothetical protein [Candidatus Poribacteria bacterium]